MFLRSFSLHTRCLLSHAHIGTVNGVQALKLDGVTGQVVEQLCLSKPMYGRKDSIDDSFLIGMGVCRQQMSLKKGDILHVSSVYNARASPYAVENMGDRYEVNYPAPYDGVMAYFVMAYTFANGEFSEFGDVPGDLSALADDAAAAQRDVAGVATAKGETKATLSCDEKSFTSAVDIRASIDTRKVELPISPDVDGSLSLYWQRSGLEDGRIEFGVEFEFANEPPSWIGVGVGSSGMIDADIVVIDFDIGTEAVELRQYWSSTYGTPTLKSDIPGAVPYSLGTCGIETKSTEKEDFWVMGQKRQVPGRTTRYVQFSRPLEGSGDFSNSLETGLNDLVYAMGFDAVGVGVEIFDYHGMNRGRIEIDIPEENLPPAV